ncbi:endogenous retrovirus group 3 member 1 Env polyprotein-like [Thamnophis elegans]|uniref:endogenous retrovirus group 3 member 1 Env polyprotein-like n=1 Tax=Thamnophis elegans TaxID=35005 RepID=UPI00137867D5|nr:endogenous retrovirus group 3 member 1 Env polyprotein-like [Thamnophis elegans]
MLRCARILPLVILAFAVFLLLLLLSHCNTDIPAPHRVSHRDAPPTSSFNCSQCIIKVSKGSATTSTLIYSNIPPEGCTQDLPKCIFNRTEFSVCKQGNAVTCHSPAMLTKYNITIWAGLGIVAGSAGPAYLAYLNHTIRSKAEQWTIGIDVCLAMDKIAFRSCGSHAWRETYKHDHKYLCTRNMPNPPEYFLHPCASWGDPKKTVWHGICDHTGGGYRGCYNPLNAAKRTIESFRRMPDSNRVSFTLSKDHPKIEAYELGIDGTGSDPLTYITITIASLKESRSIQWSVYDTIEKLETNAKSIVSEKARNLFLEFATEIAQTLGVTNCFVCGGTNMGEQWPWEALEADPGLLNNLSWGGNLTLRPHASDTAWTLTTNIVGTHCYFRNGSFAVGTLLCKGQWANSSWTSAANISQPEQLNTTTFSYFSSSTRNWTAPVGMYWVCGNLAYEYLPHNWGGSCILAWIKPSFFLLPLTARQNLGIPVYDNWRRKRALDRGEGFGGMQVGNWKDNEWPPERIIAYYDPATWAEDGSWGYRTPIYMLNRIIRLQAVLELAGNRIDRALTAIATAQDKLRTAVYQNRLALDYLLAKEGGVCGKFNLTNCCLQIDETGKVVADLTADLRKLVHVPVQKWTGLMDDAGFLGGIFRNWKQAAFMAGMALLGFLLLPCLIPVIRIIIQSTVESMTQGKNINTAIFDSQHKALLTAFPDEDPEKNDTPFRPLKI